MMKSISCILLVCPLSLMGYVEEKQVERLTRDLQDENEDIRWNAVEVLGQIGSVDAVPTLIQVLQDENEDVRWNTTKALKQIGTPEALEAVKEYQSR